MLHYWDLNSEMTNSEQGVGPKDFQVPSNLNYFMI